ncbi:MAG: NUDIX domain-containing protein [Sphingomonadales bacterium]|nr:NUDIX domain-containing protein [Sphingomonadales bacterium]MDE2570609.1 NUDIX domain-containing protein [Sphingomonadales bacterium]
MSDILDDLGAHDDAPPAIPAATVVIYRHDPQGGAAQVLMVERSASMSFAGGAAVFPGGRIDPADHELAERLAGGLEPMDAAARIAGMRETLEETGLAIGLSHPVSAEDARAARSRLLELGALAPVLEEMEWNLDLSLLVPFARWLPRHRHIKVFDTRFYLADLGTGAVDITVDATENTHLFWASPREALRLADEGRISVIFPTRRNLERLAQFDDFAACRAHAEAIPVVTITPRIEERDGVRWLTIPADAGYPYDGEPVESVARG